MAAMETWVPIAGTDGRYEISDLGRVRSWVNNRYGLRDEPKIMSAPILKRGYRQVELYVSGDGTRIRGPVHRLVCEAFNGPAPEGKPVVRHLDGDPLNNLPENLAWGTQAENLADMSRHGRSTRGTRSSNTSLTESDVREIRALRSGGMKLREIGERFGLDVSTIWAIATGKNWGWLK